jgi:hypothetical protein
LTFNDRQAKLGENGARQTAQMLQAHKKATAPGENPGEARQAKGFAAMAKKLHAQEE